jgi:endoglucanase
MKHHITTTDFFVLFFLFTCLLPTVGVAQDNPFKLGDNGVFKKHGVDMMIYNDSYNSGGFFDEKVNGIQMIQHNVRTVTGGAVRLNPTPEQWDLTPTVLERSINVEEQSVTLTLFYTEYNFTSKLKVEGKGDGCLISVILDQPVPKALEGKAGMNIEFLPATYFKKMYFMDGQTGIFPQYAGGPVIMESFDQKVPQYGNLLTNEKLRNTYAKPLPMASGKKLVFSPENPETMVSLRSLTGEIGLFDGRNLAPNGWFVVRELLPVGKTGTVVQWLLSPNGIASWIKEPVVSHSQVGYHPNLEKIAVIELDTNDKPLSSASLLRIDENGTTTKVFEGKISSWGKFMRFNYFKFDFTSVNTPGIYKIQYGNTLTDPFPISEDAYAKTWFPTLDTWFPVQMDHMFVKEAYRIWHGNPHQDDALQAPPDTAIHDGYRMGSNTDTKYKALEHIPGLNIGGWFDAGDFDIQTGSHISTVAYLCGIWEDLKPKRDQTLVDKDRKYVSIHQPDGIPDILQQIEHGTLALLAQHRAVGHAIRGIVQSRLFQYNTIGDPGGMTDGRIYNPNLKLLETDGFTSGVMDDRWAFTTYSPGTNLQSAAPIAAAARTLKGYNDALASECIQTALSIWDREVTNKSAQPVTGNMDGASTNGSAGLGGMRRGGTSTTEAAVAIELYLTTGDKKFAEYFAKLWPGIRTGLSGNGRGFGGGNIQTWLKALPFMGEDFKKDLRNYAVRLKSEMDSLKNINPYSVPLGRGGFYSGGNYSIVTWALSAAKLHKVFPDVIGTEYAIRGMNFLLGCHPASSISFVSGVGVTSKKVTYGNNRAEFTAIPGGVVPSLFLISPDFYENKEDWPFIWYENEVVVDCCAAYIYLAALVDESLR